MKSKTIVLIPFLLLSFVLIVNSQSKNKFISAKDSILAKFNTIPDSTLIYKGKFKPYKTSAHASYYADRFNAKRKFFMRCR